MHQWTVRSEREQRIHRARCRERLALRSVPDQAPAPARKWRFGRQKITGMIGELHPAKRKRSRPPARALSDEPDEIVCFNEQMRWTGSKVRFQQAPEELYESDKQHYVKLAAASWKAEARKEVKALGFALIPYETAERLAKVQSDPPSVSMVKIEVPRTEHPLLTFWQAPLAPLA